MFDKSEISTPFVVKVADGDMANRYSSECSTAASLSSPRDRADSLMSQDGGLYRSQAMMKPKPSNMFMMLFALCLGVLIGVGVTLLILIDSPSNAMPPNGIYAGDAEVKPYKAVPAPWEAPADYFAAQPLNNSCLIPNLQIPMSSDKPKTFDACGFVIQSTDEVWNLRHDVDAAIDKYFHESYINAGSWGRRMIGKKALHSAVYAEMRAFPDIKIHITDCVCNGNDVDGYKCAMPDILEGTNTGPSAYGPATGRYARWTGLVQSVVKQDPATGQWQYWAEWGVHDEWALIQQLGLDFKRVPHPPTNPEPLHDCIPLVKVEEKPVYDEADMLVQVHAR
eukprot:gnl/TRDRNA2_/TRDRNA2_182930_c0_seq1.p1 gnl/TRDRNA2_/TRDRNA2_182930_c0~~gnl/TRDRNA2_/TRDRNA2_182930_c0_seq1.p1  ORF type:complete len:337 (-),score=66.25 gnl/TRDRNA2_/TRDRNA2_182930_c0_seq1:446-1456(-)